MSGPVPRTTRFGKTVRGFKPEGLLPGPEETISIERLDPEEVEPALLDTDLKNDLAATLSDVVDATEKFEPANSSPYGYAGGARRKVRGGGETYNAIVALVNDMTKVGTAVGKGTDDAVAKAVNSIPFLLKTITVGTTVKVALNNPTLFANIVVYANKVVEYLISTKEGLATWSDYLEAGKTIGGSFKDLVGTAMQQPTTPAGAILLALFIMKYRASSAGLSLTDLIKSDAVVLKDLAASAAEGVATASLAQYSSFLKSYAQGYEEGAKAQMSANLMAFAQKVKESAPKGEGAGQISVLAVTGAPSVEMGPNGEVISVPATKRKAFTEALDKLTKISARGAKVSQKEKVAAAAVVPVAAAAEAADAEALANASGQGGRRRKTKKGKSKRRITRRARKYLAAPVFAY